MTQNKFILILLAFLASFCSKTGSENADGGFVLNGTLKGIPNDTWIYLMLNNEEVDSTQFENGVFIFEGSIKHPTRFSLLIRETNEYKRIWIEPSTITLSSEDGHLESANITGSKSEIERGQLWVLIDAYWSKRDSLTRIVRSDITSDSLKSIAKEELNIVRDNRLVLETDFIANNPSSYLSAYMLDVYSTTFGNTKTQKLFNLLTTNIRESSYGASIQHFLDLNEDVNIGNRYVNFSMKDTEGREVQVSDFEGQVILLDFWASWCGPCIKEYPALREVYSKYKDQGFVIIGVSQDQSEEHWRNVIKSENLEWINLWDPNGMKSEPHLIYGINGIPDSFLIDGEGIIVARNLRGNSLIKKIGELVDSASL